MKKYLFSLKKPWQRLLALASIAVALRILTFFRSVIDHDESTYIVIGNAVLHGARYWIDVIDVKPVGIFWLYAGFQAIFGYSIFAMRLMAAVWLGLTAFFMVETKLRLGSTPKAAFASGVIFLILNSLFTFYGISPNTETFFTLFTMLAFWLAFRAPGALGFFLSGLMLGLGFIIKYVVAFDALVLGLFILVGQWVKTPQKGKLILHLAGMVAGFFIPLAGVYAYYHSLGAVDQFLFYTFEVSKRYPVDAGLWDHIRSFADLNLRFLPVSFMFYYALLHRNTLPVVRRLGLLWGALVLIPILLPGKFFGHYFIQFFLPFSFVAGEFFARPAEELPRMLRPVFRPKLGYSLLALVLAANFYFHKKDYLDRPDTPRQLAAVLKPMLGEEDVLYLGNYHQIVYYLLRKQSPSPYVHRGLLWTEEHQEALGIDTDREVRRIFDANPRIVVVQDSIPNALFNQILEKEYRKRRELKTEKGVALWVFERE